MRQKKLEEQGTAEQRGSDDLSPEEYVHLLYSSSLIITCAIEVHPCGTTLDVDNGSRFPHPRTRCWPTIEA
jgi:hypothetical protein